MPCSRLLLIIAACGALPALTAGEADGPPPRPNPEALFTLFDTDSDGALSKAEFSAGLAELGRRGPPPRDGEGGRPPGPPTSGDGQRPPPPASGDGPGQRPPPPGGEGGRRPPPPPGGNGPGHRPPPPAGGDGSGQRPPPAGGDGEHGQRPAPPTPAERQQAIDAAFTAGDADANGSLTKAEFIKAMQAMPKPPRPPGERPPGKAEK